MSLNGVQELDFPLKMDFQWFFEDFWEFLGKVKFSAGTESLQEPIKAFKRT